MTTRLPRLRQAIKASGADCMVVQDAVALDYLTGFGEDGHERFLALFVDSEGTPSLICPALSESQAKRSGFKDIHSWRDGEDPLALFKSLAELKNWSIFQVDDYLKARHLIEMQETLPTAKFKRGGPVLEELMRHKDKDEIDLLFKVGKIADEAWLEVKPQIKAGQTELQVAEMLGAAMKKRGGRPTFCIVAAGAMGAEPHHSSDGTVLKDGDVVVCDFGCDLEGYQSDITRMVALGQPGEEAKKVYDIVLRAHHAGRTAVKPGVSRDSVDAAARKVIKDAGYGEYFTHRLGHGLGRRAHEEPYLTPGDTRPLQEGDCFSIEPGIYLPGKFGVRIENIVTILDGKCVSFNEEPEGSL